MEKITLQQAIAHLKSSGFQANSMQVLAYIAAYNAAADFYRLQVEERLTVPKGDVE